MGLLIIPICSIWPGHEKSHVPGVGRRFRSVASPQLSSFQPLTPLEVLLYEMATLTVPCECAAGMMLRVRRLNREAVYSGPADAKEALELPRGNRYTVADDRGKWYGRMENGGICIYARITRTRAHVFIASRLAGIGEKTILLLRVWAPLIAEWEVRNYVPIGGRILMNGAPDARGFTPKSIWEGNDWLRELRIVE